MLNSSGHDNLGIGNNCMLNNIGGYNNICIGNSSNVSASPWVDPSLGPINQIVIGHSAVGNSNNTVVIGNTDITSVHLVGNGPGGATCYAQSYNLTSDERLKTNIEPTDLGLDFINKLTPVSFKWKTVKQHDKTQYGLIAQEVVKTFNDFNLDENEYSLINYDENLDKYGLDYTQLISPLIKAIQELNQQIIELKAKSNA